MKLVHRAATHWTFRLAPLALIFALTVAACAPAQQPLPPAQPAAAPAKEAPAPAAKAAEPAAKPAAPAPAAPAAPAKPVQKVALKSAFTTTSATMGPLWSAKDGGFFEDEGLEVTLSRIQSGAPILAALRGGDVPIAFVGAQQIVEANAKGGDYVLVAGYIDSLTQSIFVLPSIDRPEQLKGKAIGVTNFGAITHVAARVGLEQLGLKDQVTFKATGGPPETIAAMQAGVVQGGVFSPPDTLKARELGYRELLDVSKTGVKSQTSAVATTRKWLQENPDLVERYIRATIKAVHRLKTDKAFGMKAIATGSGMEDPRLLEETYDYYKELWGRDGSLSIPGIQQNIDIAGEDIPEAKALKPEQIIDTKILDKIKASGLVEQLWGKY